MNLEEYAQREWEKEGTYRAFPIAWTLEKKESGAVAIAFKFALHQEWHGKDQGWSVEWAPGYWTTNRTWIVKKDGELNQSAVDNLGKCGLWDGDFDKIAGPVPSVFVLVDIGCETYENKTRYRADWINPNADEPKPRGGFTPTDPNVLAQLRARFQSATRAIAGGAPAGTAPAPPATPAPAPTPAVAPAAVAPAAAPPETLAPLAAPAPLAPVAPTVPQAAPPATPAAPAAPGAPPAPTPAPIAQPQPTPAEEFLAPPAAGDADDPADPDGPPF